MSAGPTGPEAAREDRREATGESVTVRVTLRRSGSSGHSVETDPPGLVPEGMDVEAAFMRLGGEMLLRLARIPPAPAPRPRFGRPGRGLRGGT